MYQISRVSFIEEMMPELLEYKACLHLFDCILQNIDSIPEEASVFMAQIYRLSVRSYNKSLMQAADSDARCGRC